MGFLKDLFGPRQPCALCHLGQTSWPSPERSGTADWKLEHQGFDACLLVCVPCRTFLVQTGLALSHPMVALAQLVSLGQAHRPAIAAYLQHPEWRKIWTSILHSRGVQTTDDLTALRMMAPIEEELMSLSADHSAGGDLNFGTELNAMMDAYGIPEDLVRRKYLTYAAMLRATGKQSRWNDQADATGLTADEIEAAKYDFHQAVLNRIKTDFANEGWLPIY